VNRHAIHARVKVRSKRFRVTSQLNLFVDLRLNELFLGGRVERSKGVVMSEWPRSEVCVGKRPKTFSEADTNRTDESGVRMVRKKRLELVDVDNRGNAKKM
jgi:hypothetical protein